MSEGENDAVKRVEAFLNEWPNRSGNGNIIYSLGMDDGYCELTVSDLRALIAAQQEQPK